MEQPAVGTVVGVPVHLKLSLEDDIDEGEEESYVVLIVDSIVQNLWPLDDFVRSNVWVSLDRLWILLASLDEHSLNTTTYSEPNHEKSK